MYEEIIFDIHLILNHFLYSIILDFKKWNLIALRDIKSGEELTVKYEWYQVT